MAQWLKVPATKLDNLSLISAVRLVRRENQLQKIVFWLGGGGT